MTVLTVESFRRKWRGKRIGGYTSRGGQCVDQMREWIRNLTGNAYHGLPRVVAAKDAFAAADPRKWRKVRWDGCNVPPVGAILVFARGRWGHVAVARAHSTRSRVASFDQNWSVDYRCTDEAHPNADHQLVGWLIKR